MTSDLDGEGRVWHLRGWAPAPGSVPDLRHRVQDVLVAWAPSTTWDLLSLGGDLELLLSEVATNAVLHARTPFDVGLTLTDHLLRCEVSDDDPRTPRSEGPDADASNDLESLGGRGLLLIDRLAQTWGIDQRLDGKTVWFTLAPPARG